MAAVDAAAGMSGALSRVAGVSNGLAAAVRRPVEAVRDSEDGERGGGKMNRTIHVYLAGFETGGCDNSAALRSRQIQASKAFRFSTPVFSRKLLT